MQLVLEFFRLPTHIILVKHRAVESTHINLQNSHTFKGVLAEQLVC